MWKLTLAFVAFASVAQAQEMAGEVLFANGKAMRVPAAGTPQPLARGDKIFEGDLLRTASDAHLQLRMRDDAFIALRPDSELRVKAYGERAFLQLVKGALRSITGAIGQRDRSHYLLESHRVVVGIRGTDHEARVVPGGPHAGHYDRVTHGGSYLKTAEGSVDIDAGRTGFARLEAGHAPRLLEETPEFMLASLPPARPDTGPRMRGLLHAPGLERAPGLDHAPGLPRSQAPSLLLERSRGDAPRPGRTPKAK